MSIHWVPTTLKHTEQQFVEKKLEETPADVELGGGGSGDPTYELVDNPNVTYTGTLDDAVSYFVKVMRDDNTRTPRAPPEVPTAFMGGITDAVSKGVGCSCATVDCTERENCAAASETRGNEFLEAYKYFLSRGTQPTTLHIRKLHETGRGQEYNFHITFPFQTPSFEDVRHGVIAKMHVSTGSAFPERTGVRGKHRG